MEKMIIGIDVGGTKVAGGLVDNKGSLDRTVTLPTKANEGFETSFSQIMAVIKRLISQAEVFFCRMARTSLGLTNWWECRSGTVFCC